MIGRNWKHSNVWRRPVLIHQTNQHPVFQQTTHRTLFASTMQSLTQHTQNCHNDISILIITITSTPKMCRWLIAAGKRPVPFRTRKLSPPAPMVLHSGGCGRVGYRRPNNFKHSTPPWTLYGPRRGAFCHPTGCVAVGRHSSGWNEFVISTRFSGVCAGGGDSITPSFHHTTTKPVPRVPRRHRHTPAPHTEHQAKT